MGDQQIPSDPQPWQTLSTRVEFDNRWAGIAVDEVRLPNGVEYEYTRLRPAGVGVAVAAFDPDGRILLEREYRHGLGQVIWQLPGGLVDEGEDLTTAGLRELAEETGYVPQTVNYETVRYLGAVWDNPGLGTTISHIVAAFDVSPSGNVALEPTEFIALHWCSVDWLKEAIRSGEIKERTTVAAVTYLLLNQLI
jgi:8-oxo-dGTP pyrophosphatase MutT (NUDIX family)